MQGWKTMQNNRCLMKTVICQSASFGSKFKSKSVDIILKNLTDVALEDLCKYLLLCVQMFEAEELTDELFW